MPANSGGLCRPARPRPATAGGMERVSRSARQTPTPAEPRTRDAAGIRARYAWLGAAIPRCRLLRNERSSMPPAARHDKFAEGLACPGGQFPLSQLLGQRLWIPGIAEGDRRNSFPIRGDAENLPGLVGIEASHL